FVGGAGGSFGGVGVVEVFWEGAEVLERRWGEGERWVFENYFCLCFGVDDDASVYLVCVASVFGCEDVCVLCGEFCRGGGSCCLCGFVGVAGGWFWAWF
ncbi:MAG: hypothetical protein WC651_00005, partial [Candidatus Gracilibacteria bacterium]